MRKRFLVVAWLFACQGSQVQPPLADAYVPTCDDVPSAWLGRCELMGSGQECVGAFDEQRRFAGFADGVSLALITGPQGSQMFVLAVQTQDIDPGNPQDPADAQNPTAKLTLIEAGQPLALYRGRPPFLVDGGDPTRLVAAALYVILDPADVPPSGTALEVIAEVTDAHGAYRCGRLSFALQ